MKAKIAGPRGPKTGGRPSRTVTSHPADAASERDGVAVHLQGDESFPPAEAGLRALFAAMQDVVLVIDRLGVYREIAPTDPGLLYQPPHELLGKNLRDLFPAQQAELLIETIRQVLATGQTARTEYELPIGGRQVWFATSISRMDGERTLWVARDITEGKRTEEALRESDDRFRQIVETAQEGVWTLDTANRTTLVNKCLADMLGYTIGEMLGKSLLDFMDEEDKKAISEKGLANTQSRANVQFDFKFRGKDGRTVWALMKTSRLLDRNGQNAGALAMLTDITNRKQLEGALVEKERILSEAQAIAHIGSWGWDFVGPIQWTEETYRVYGVSPATFVPTIESLVSLLHPDDRLPMQQWIEAHAAGQSPADLDFRTVLPDGSVRFITGRGGELRYDSQNRPVYMTGTAQDVTESRRLERELQHMQESLVSLNRDLQVALAREETLARTDGLTGLCNRIYFDELAAREFQAAVRYQRIFAIMMIDIDNFKRINDSLGHAAGDEVLALIADTVSKHIRGTDVLARFGGDEFILLLTETNAGQARTVAERIRTRVAATPMRAGLDAAGLTLSIGIAELRRSPLDESVEQVIRRADQALYKAKAEGRNRVVALQENSS